MKKLVILLLTMVLCLSLTACGEPEPTDSQPTSSTESTDVIIYTEPPCPHMWQNATCEEPQTCTICGKTQGHPLNHRWAAATCNVPKTCTVCFKTDGELLPHQWQDATCEKPETCAKCGKTEGEIGTHSYQETVREEATTTENGYVIYTCSICGDNYEEVLYATDCAGSENGSNGDGTIGE